MDSDTTCIVNKQAGAYWLLVFVVVSALSVAHAQAETDPCKTASGAVPMIPECSDHIPDTWIADYLVYSFNNRGTPSMEEICDQYDSYDEFFYAYWDEGWSDSHSWNDYDKFYDAYYDEDYTEYEQSVYLNHTIHNGELKGICFGGAYYWAELSFEIEATDEGYLILDIPHDLFMPRDGHGYAEMFGVNVYSTKYTTWEYKNYLDRDYHPLVREEMWIGDMTEEKCLSSYEKTCDELWEGHVEYVHNRYPPEIQHMMITKLGSFDTFDRYKFPFLKDDYFFDLSLTVETGASSTVRYERNPQKYTNPDNVVVSIVTSDADVREILPPKKQVASGIPLDQVQCDAGKTLLVRHDAQKAVCVYESSVERLVLLGFEIT